MSFCLVGLLSLASCEINDPINDLMITGKKGANVYMEIPFAYVKAGESVEFYTEYWSEDDEFKNLEIWYSIQTQLNYELKASINGYAFTLDSTELAREFQKIEGYEHDASNYKESKYAYVLEDNFPVSYTLSPTIVNRMDDYDQNQIDRFFPVSVIDRFYSGFFETLDYDLLSKLLVEMHQIVTDVEFEEYFEIQEIPDPEQEGSTIEVKVMKEEAVPVLKEMVRQISLGDLVYEKDLKYNVVYNKSYELLTKFRVINGKGAQNFSAEIIVTVQ